MSKYLLVDSIQSCPYTPDILLAQHTTNPALIMKAHRVLCLLSQALSYIMLRGSLLLLYMYMYIYIYIYYIYPQNPILISKAPILIGPP